MKRNYWAEFAITMVTLVGAWYLQEDRPAPVPAFWFYLSKESRKVADYATHKYLEAVNKVYL